MRVASPALERAARATYPLSVMREYTENYLAAGGREDFSSYYTADHKSARLRDDLRHYLHKMRGTTRGSPPRVSRSEILWSWIGGFVGVGLVAWINERVFAGTEWASLFASNP